MAASEVAIANMALGWLGGELIISFDDESVEARLIKANYEFARDAVLEDHSWTFATARTVLTPTTEEPVWGSTMQFLIPPDTIRILRVSQTQNDEDNLDWVREGRLIIANRERIYVTYTKRITNPAEFPPNFVHTLAQRLAADLAIPLTESRSLQETHWAVYMEKIKDAAATDGMQGRSPRTKSTRLLGSRSGFFPGSGGFAIGDPLV